MRQTATRTVALRQAPATLRAVFRFSINAGFD
jgi:hypothetical protein